MLHDFELFTVRNFLALGCSVLLTACYTERLEIHAPDWQPVDFAYDHYERPYSFGTVADQLTDVQEAGVENSLILGGTGSYRTGNGSGFTGRKISVNIS